MPERKSEGLDAASWAQQEIARYAEAAGKGDRMAFSALFGLRASHVYASLGCLVGGDTLLDALAIRVFDRAWHELSLLERPERFDTWLLDLVIEVAADAPRVGDERRGGLAAVSSALAALVPRHREVVLLRNVFRLSAASVGEAFDVDPDEVHRLEHAALQLMSERIAA